jgi:hypothetical protein
MEANVQPAPVPIPFPVEGANPGPRCGHTLTVVIGTEQRLSASKLVMFGAWRCLPRALRSNMLATTELKSMCHTGGATALEGPDGGTQPAATAAGAFAFTIAAGTLSRSTSQMTNANVRRYSIGGRDK